ncbi:MAG: indoleacetamide hydrolase [Candidatus Thiodiazotropha sp. (ex Dulcina madagascariensis)]|nr:indoleacetamide hydrolase [Candidatus Thiodiazotropha sp. (ex Dulcina madagascariensis)]
MKKNKQARRIFSAFGFLALMLGLFPPAQSLYHDARADSSGFTDGEILEFTAKEALQVLEGGGLTAVHYVDVLLGRAAQYEDYNTFIHLDPAQVRAAAVQSDQVRASGVPVGPLHGLPIVIKDNMNTFDMPTTGGTPALAYNQPMSDAAVVQTLRDAGAIIMGKVNLHELAGGVTSNNPTFGTVGNPYGKTRIPGGSSGGNAVAVGGRMAPVGIGTDTGGSVRIPAALCGIVGFRPTKGRYSHEGIIKLSETRSTSGPMTRSVGDAALIDAVLTGGDLELQVAELDGLRLGVPRQYFYENLHPDVNKEIGKVLHRLERAGVVLVEADIPDVGALVAASSFPIMLYESIFGINQYLSDQNAGIDYTALASQVASPGVQELMFSALYLMNAGLLPQYYDAAMNIYRPALQWNYAQYFAVNDVEAVLIPTTILPAAKIGNESTVHLNGQDLPLVETYIQNTDPSSIAGIPSISLPVALTKEKLPVGLELDGPVGSDRRLLAIASAIEAVAPQPRSPNM